MEISSTKIFLPPIIKSLKEDQAINNNCDGSKKKEDVSPPSNTEIKSLNQNAQVFLSCLSQTKQQTKSENFRITTRRANSQTTSTKVCIMSGPSKTIKGKNAQNLTNKENMRIKSADKMLPKEKFILQAETKITAASCSSVPEPKEISDDFNDYLETDLPEVEEEIEIQDEQVCMNIKKKKKKRITLLKDMVPLNLEEERIKFFEFGFNYNPRFEYKMEQLNQKFEEPHSAYLNIAETILDKCIKDFGDDDNYIERTGGKVCSQQDIETHFVKYVNELGLEKRLNLVFSEKIISSASCLYRWKGKGTILIALPIVHREKRLLGVLDHEIGTHFIRKVNERQQPWSKNRKQYGLKSCLVIEEGLAMLNQTLEEASDPGAKPYLFSAALHYYACYKAGILTFEDLFKDLEKYIKDPIRRWKECIRVKRGISDTSKPGGMYKDQVYLRGAIKILQNRNEIDFVRLHAGKLTIEDLKKVTKNEIIKTDKLKLPNFLRDLEKYKAALDRIASINQIDNVC